MTGTNKKALRLADALVEDILSTPDREILAEFTDLNGDPRKNSDAMRALFEKSVLRRETRGDRIGSGGEREGS